MKIQQNTQYTILTMLLRGAICPIATNSGALGDDLVVASVLMALGMMMLSPMMISLPFKIMMFVLIDGWALILGTLATSFYT